MGCFVIFKFTVTVDSATSFMIKEDSSFIIFYIYIYNFFYYRESVQLPVSRSDAGNSQQNQEGTEGMWRHRAAQQLCPHTICGDRQKVKEVMCYWDSHSLVPQRNPNICKVRLVVTPQFSHPSESEWSSSETWRWKRKTKNVTFCLQFQVSQEKG